MNVTKRLGWNAALIASAVLISGGSAQATEIVANFTDGNGIDSVDQYEGIFGDGWGDGWQALEGSSETDGIESATVINSNPLNGGGNYLSVEKIPGSVAFGTVSREYSNIGNFDVAEEHVISWDFRYDGSVEDTDRVHFFGDPEPDPSTDSGNSWIVGRANTAFFGVGNWYFYNNANGVGGGSGGFNAANTVDTGISFVEGTVYSFEVTVNPALGVYDAMVTDGTNTFSDTDLVFRNGLTGAFPNFHAGTGTSDDTFSIDSIKIDNGLTPEPPNADFDDDGDIDGADFLAWQQGFELEGPSFADGDSNTDGRVNGTDLAVWESQFGTTPVVALATVVPEPTTLGLSAFLLLGVTVGSLRLRR